MAGSGDIRPRLTAAINGLGPGGAERVMSMLVNHLAAKGWPVTLTTLEGPDPPPHYDLSADVAWTPLSLSGETRGAWEKVAANVGRARRLKDHIRSTRPDVVLSFGHRTNVLTLAAAIGLGVPVVVAERTVPETEPHEAAWRGLRRLIYPRATILVCQESGSAAYFQRFMPQGRVRIIPNPAPLVEATAGSQPLGSGRHLVAMGRLGPEKGFDLLIDAFARTVGRHPDWRLTIWGDGPLRGELKRRVAARGLVGRVRLPGLTRRPFDVLRRADLFVLPSRYEGFPNALMEAMALGRPVVAADCPHGPRAIVRHGVDGLLAPPENPAALAEALDFAMSDFGRRQRWGRRAAEVRDRFASDRVLSRWERLLSSLVR